MKTRTVAAVQADIDRLSKELVELDAVAEPTEEQVARSAAALDEFTTAQAELAPAQEHEARMELVRSAAAAASNREPGHAGTPRKATGAPEIKRSKESVYAGLGDILRGRFDDDDVIERAKYAVELAPRHLSEVARAHIMSLIEVDPYDENRQAPLIARHMLATGSDAYHQAFQEYMRTGFPNEVLRATMTLTDANGGFLVPFTLDPTIILTNAGIKDPIRGISTVKQIATDNWNGVSSAGVTASWTAEGSEMADASPTFAQPTITPKRADAWVEGTYEMLADSGFASQLGRLLADAKVRHEGAAFATANTGATRPRGIVAAVAAVTAQIVASAATNALAVGDVYNLVDALRARDEDQASIIGNKKIFSKVRQFDTAGGSSFWASLGAGQPDRLLGQPRYSCSTMEANVTTGGLVLLAGNFEHYVIVDRIGMSVQYDPMLKGSNGRANGKAGWAAFWRVGADVDDVTAFKVLQLNQTAAFVALA